MAVLHTYSCSNRPCSRLWPINDNLTNRVVTVIDVESAMMRIKVNSKVQIRLEHQLRTQRSDVFLFVFTDEHKSANDQ